jgi:hypothetical protein
MEDIQDRFKAATPKVIAQYDPNRVVYMWNYAAKRTEEHWQDPKKLEAARALAKIRKGRKP